jgi:hypothetical protein
LIRLYDRHSDDPVLYRLLAGEGYAADKMGYANFETWVLEEDGIIKGFFTLRRAHGLPYLDHFCVAPPYRARLGAETPYVGWRLLRALKEKIRAHTRGPLILNSKTGDKFTERIISRVFKAKQYAQENGVSFYLTEAAHV